MLSFDISTKPRHVNSHPLARALNTIWPAVKPCQEIERPPPLKSAIMTNGRKRLQSEQDRSDDDIQPFDEIKLKVSILNDFNTATSSKLIELKQHQHSQSQSDLIAIISASTGRPRVSLAEKRLREAQSRQTMQQSSTEISRSQLSQLQQQQQYQLDSQSHSKPDSWFRCGEHSASSSAGISTLSPSKTVLADSSLERPIEALEPVIIASTMHSTSLTEFTHKPSIKSTSHHRRASTFFLSARSSNATTPTNRIQPLELPAAYPIFVCFDLETTGLSITSDRIVQIAARIDPGWLKCMNINEKNLVTTFSSIVNPGIKIPKLAQNIHGITDDIAEKFPTTVNVLQAFDEFLVRMSADVKEHRHTATNVMSNEFELILIAHNGFCFDQPLFEAECQRCDYQIRANIRFADTLYSIKNSFPQFNLAAETYNGNNTRQRGLGLESLMRQLVDKHFQQDHSALGDVNALLRVMECWPWRTVLYEALYSDCRYTQF
jgi:DNA polymerase III epsilon subunit-like protein